MKTVEVLCDGCGKDITDTREMPSYRIGVYCEKLPHTSNIVLGVMVSPPLNREHHFCGLSCLKIHFTEEHNE